MCVAKFDTRMSIPRICVVAVHGLIGRIHDFEILRAGCFDKELFKIGFKEFYCRGVE
jgi:hypothetical protein